MQLIFDFIWNQSRSRFLATIGEREDVATADPKRACVVTVEAQGERRATIGVDHVEVAPQANGDIGVVARGHGGLVIAVKEQRVGEGWRGKVSDGGWICIAEVEVVKKSGRSV